MELLQQLLARPDANMLIDRANEILQAEHVKREQFYNDITPNDKAEFIQGEVIFHSPVKNRHNRVTLRIAKILDTIVAVNDLGQVGIEKLLISLTRNDYEPDVCFFSKVKSDAFTDDQMQFPAPDLVVEVLSESTEKRDRGVKFDDYALHGVNEYWIVDPDNETVEQYLLDGTTYKLHIKTQDGHITSQAIPNLRVLATAFFNDSDNLSEIKRLL